MGGLKGSLAERPSGTGSISSSSSDVVVPVEPSEVGETARCSARVMWVGEAMLLDPLSLPVSSAGGSTVVMSSASPSAAEMTCSSADGENTNKTKTTKKTTAFV